MKLINKYQNKIISTNLEIASSLKDLIFGLLIKPKGTSLLFKTRWGIHTLLMKYPIDVLILDQNLRVVKIKTKLYPNRFFFWNPIYSIVIELPPNKTSGTKIGHLFQIH